MQNSQGPRSTGAIHNYAVLLLHTVRPQSNTDMMDDLHVQATATLSKSTRVEV